MKDPLGLLERSGPTLGNCIVALVDDDEIVVAQKDVPIKSVATRHNTSGERSIQMHLGDIVFEGSLFSRKAYIKWVSVGLFMFGPRSKPIMFYGRPMNITVVPGGDTTLNWTDSALTITNSGVGFL